MRWIKLISWIVLLSGFGQQVLAQGPNTVYSPCARVLTGLGQDSISWSANPCTNFDYYIILGNSTPGAPLTAIDTVFNANQTGIIHPNPGETAREYQVLLRCNGGNNTDLTIIVSNQQPITPSLQYVTILNGVPQIAWDPSPSPEVIGYQIYKEQPYGSGNYFPYPASNQIVNALSYTDINNTSQPVRYAIAAISPCNAGQLSAGNAIDGTTGPHSSILLQAELQGCSEQIRLNWNPYENWLEGVDVYEIWVSTNGGADQLLDTTSDTSYIYSNFNDGDQLEFFVRALEKNRPTVSSSSNRLNLSGLVNRPMDFLQLTNVTVDPASGGLQVDWSWDTDTDFESAALLRGPDTNSLSEVLSISAIASEDNSFLDTDVNTDEERYVYQVQSTDACGQVVTSNWGQSTLLSGKVLENYRNELSWSPLAFEYGVLQSYGLYKEVNGTASRVANLTNLGDTLEVNQVNVRNPSESTSCYYVELNVRLEFPGGDLRFMTSRSNTICLDHQASMYFPNALVPNGKNPYFRPVVVYGHTLTNYELQIYNRYGKLVFQTTDYGDNFEGRDQNGKPLQQGAYVYIARYTLGNGKMEEQKGTVMVLR